MREFNHRSDKDHERRHEGRHAGKHRGRHEGKHRGRPEERQHGAKTFRRGRALDFLGLLEVKRDTLKQQLEAPEYQGIQSILIGELKAVETIIQEYVRHFELNEIEDQPEDSEQPSAEQAESGEGDINT